MAGSVTDPSAPHWNHLLQGLRSRVPHLMDREVFALLEGLPTLITDIIPYLCHGEQESHGFCRAPGMSPMHRQLPTPPVGV